MSDDFAAQYQAHQKKLKQVNLNPVLTQGEKKSLNQLGKTLKIPNLVEIFSACAKESALNNLESPAPKVIVALHSDDKQTVLEELVACGKIVPSFQGIPRHLRLAFAFNRYHPETPQGSLFTAGFMPAAQISNHAEKYNNPGKLVCWMASYKNNSDPAQSVILPESPLPQVQSLVDVLKADFLKDRRIVMLDRNTMLRQNP
jgi:hypothetical protein